MGEYLADRYDEERLPIFGVLFVFAELIQKVNEEIEKRLMVLALHKYIHNLPSHVRFARNQIYRYFDFIISLLILDYEHAFIRIEPILPISLGNIFGLKVF
jgi:hypothetical protein